MEQIDFLALYRKALIAITDGPFKGKFTIISEIDYSMPSVVSKGGERLPIEILKPVLRGIDQINPAESSAIWKLYWGGAEHSPLIGLFPSPQDIKDLFDGVHYSCGDFEEVIKIFNLCVEWNIDVVGGIKKGWAIRKK